MALWENTAGTIVAVVGEASDEALAALDALPGVEALSLSECEPALATRRIARTGTPWVAHDADPLGHVAAAWVELYEERSTLGALEAEVDNALELFESGAALMPDYYIVLDPQDAPDTWRHWWCGALGRHSPRRVLPVSGPSAARAAALRNLLTRLPPSRPWPHPASWLPELPYAVPDRVGLRR
ncbi:MAG: hypothetical protein QM677_02775 [Microbacterium sp.]